MMFNLCMQYSVAWYTIIFLPFLQLCTVKGDTLIECPSPAVPTTLVPSQRKRRETADEPHFGFIMDSVASVQDIPANFPSVPATVNVVYNPVYYPFDLGVLQYKGDFLVLDVSKV